MSDQSAFLDVVASCEEAASKTETGTGWLPPEGDYKCRFEELLSGTGTKDGVKTAWVKPQFTIVGSEFDGKTFSEFMYFRAGAAETSPAMRSLLTLASLISGRTVRSSGEAGSILISAAEDHPMLLIRRKDTPKKDKAGNPTEGVWENINYVKLITE